MKQCVWYGVKKNELFLLSEPLSDLFEIICLAVFGKVPEIYVKIGEL